MTAIVRSFVIAPALNGAFFAVAAARRTDVVTLRVPGASVCIHYVQPRRFDPRHLNLMQVSLSAR